MKEAIECVCVVKRVLEKGCVLAYHSNTTEVSWRDKRREGV